MLRTVCAFSPRLAVIARVACAAVAIAACEQSGAPIDAATEGGPAGSPGGGGSLAIGSDTGTAGAGAGGAGAGAGGLDAAGAGATSAGADAIDAAVDGGTQGAALPVATSPCGAELDVDNGAVVPSLGDVPDGGSVSSSLSQNGSLAVATQGVSISIDASTVMAAGQRIMVGAGTINGTAYVPDGSGPYPLVLVLPGFSTSYTAYAEYSLFFASHGFVVLGLDTRSNPATASHDVEAVEVTQAIDFALSDTSPFADKLDHTKIVVSGHSKGGKLAFYAAALDPRIDLVIGWDPVNAGGPPCFVDPASCHRLPVAPNCSVMDPGVLHYMRAESLVIGAPPDASWNPEPTHNAEHFYRGVPSPAAYVKLAAGHVDWVPGITSKPDLVRITKATQLALLRTRLQGTSGLATHLPGGSGLASEALVTDARVK